MMIQAGVCDASPDHCFMARGMLGQLGDRGEIPWVESTAGGAGPLLHPAFLTLVGEDSGLSPCVLPDRDECEQPSICQGQRCINTLGSYHCQCKEGFAMGPRGQCEGKACCSQFVCASSLPCAWLNTSFTHHSVSPPVREVGHPHICLPCTLPLSSPLTAEGKGFPGQREWSSPKILSRLSMELPNGQPIPASHYGRTCLYIFMPPWLCHKTVMLAGVLQGEEAAETQATHPHCIPFTQQDLGPSKLSPLSMYDVPDQRFPFLSSSSPSQSGRLF